MIRRSKKRKKQRQLRAIAKGDEPPDPVTLTVLAVTGVVIGAAGTAFSAVAAKSQANQQAALADANAAASARDAQWARNQATYNEARARERANRIRGEQRAGIGASGVDFSGSPLDLLEETAIQTELESQQIKRTGEFTAGGYDFQSSASRFRADAFRSSGNTALTTGMISAGGQLASGLTTSGYNYGLMKGKY